MTQVFSLASLLAIMLTAFGCFGLAGGSGRPPSGEPILLSGKARSAALCVTSPNPFKPYTKELRSPAGVQVLLDSPSDHKHHHALMFAVSAGGVDFWGEHDANVVGRQVVEKQARRGRRLIQELIWRAPDGGVKLSERRRLQLWDEPDCTLLSWESQLRAPENIGSIELSGAHYVGLGLRPLPSFNAKCRFVYPDGPPGPIVRGDERLTPGRWCGMVGAVDGKPITIAMMAHPENARTPTRFFTMSTHFAYLAATLGLHEQPLSVAAERPLTLRYGVAVWDGEEAPQEMEKTYQRWLKLEGEK
ncbi:PmoA family protein [bacterium]|nr:PmoA family protein [bacterium]